jgi:hypothetical protein
MEEAEKLVNDDGSDIPPVPCEKIDAIEENILIDDDKKKSTDINITNEICKTSNWKCINSHNSNSNSNSTHSPEKSSSVKHRKHNGHHHHHHHHGHHKEKKRRPNPSI